MAISNLNSDAETLLLQDTVDRCVDYKGRPVNRASSGGWRSAYFIIGVEMAERLAFHGIRSNLITYLTGALGQSTATAAENVNTWLGTSTLLPLLGGFVADSFLGRYWTIVVASLIYVLGLGFLTFSAILISVSNSDCQDTNKFTSPSPNQFQVILFFFSLYLIAIGQGGHKPCVQAFGADQFDGKHPKEIKWKSSFFNWWYFGLCMAALFAYLIINYIQENINWGLGFGIPCIFMVLALIFFLLGTKTYRYSIKGDEKSPFLRIGKASTFFTKQGATMDRSVGQGIDIPAASLQSFINFAIVLTMPIYDLIFVPIARAFTGKPAGITKLQRIGTGIFLSVIDMIISALVEMKRLKTAEGYGLIDQPNVTVPMSVWWLVPQYVVYGVSEAFTIVGLQEFFYVQVPSELRSVGLSLYLSIFGVGSFLSSLLISTIEKATGGDGHDSWFANNLNKGHLDYFYWLLAGLSAVGLIIYLHFAKSYIYNRASTI